MAIAASGASDFVDPMKHDIFVITPKTFDNLISKYRNSDGVAVMVHYSSSDSSQRKYIDSKINPIASELKGMVRFGAIDCGKSDHKKFCQANENPDVQTPMVILYPPNPLPPRVIENPHDSKMITQVAMRSIPGKNVDTLENLEKSDVFFDPKHLAVPKVLLFSDKEKVPILFKALANSFRDRMSFGFVPASSTAGLEKKFKVSKPYPKVILVRVAAKGGGLGKPEPFPSTSKFTFEGLHDWLNIHAETFVKGGGFTEEGPSSGNSEGKPWLGQAIPELTGPSQRDVCFGSPDLCGILLTEGEITETQKETMVKLKDKWRDTIKKWGWLDIGRETAFRELFGGVKTVPSYVVLNPKKPLRFLVLSEGTEATEESVDNLLERVVSGATYKRVKKVPSFASRKVQKEEL